MQIPGLGGRSVPVPAVIAIGVLGVLGCALLVFAALALRGAAPAEPKGPTETATKAAHTAVPTVILTRTPVPTATDTNTPIPTATEPPTESATPEVSNTPQATVTRTRAPATAVSATRAATAPPAPTQPPAPTVAPTQAPASGGGSHGITGSLSLCNPKPSYAAKSASFEGERICVNELITNNTDLPITYGVLGVRAENTSGGAHAFQTSWRGDLSVPAHSNGPTGGGWQDGLYLPEGSYLLSLSICYSNVDTCLGGSGDWETLTATIAIQVVPWTP